MGCGREGRGFALGPPFFSNLGALFAPIAPAVMPGDGVEPAIVDAFFEDPEADREGKVESRGGQHAGHQPGSLPIEVAHQQIGHEPAQHALDGQLMEPAPVPGQQGEGGRQKDDGQEGADPAQHGRLAGARLHPGPADSAQPNGQEKGRKPQRLQQQVGEPGAEEADPIVRGQAGGGVQRGVSGRVGGEREDEEERDQQQHEPQKQVQGSSLRGRQNNANGFHGEGAPVLRLPRNLPRASRWSGENNPRAAFIMAVQVRDFG